MEEVCYQYDILVCGATLLGLGIAYSKGSKALVIERTSEVGHEFISSLHQGEDWDVIKLSSKGLEFRNELLDRNLLTLDGKVHLPGIAPVLYNRISRDGLNVLMLTEIVSVENKGTYYEVTIFNTSGLQKIYVKEVIDTTSQCLTLPEYKVKFAKKNINAFVHSNATKNLPTTSGNVVLAEGLLNNEVVMSFNVDCEDSWVNAREKLHRFWLSRPAELTPWQMDSVAAEFDVLIEEPGARLMDRWLWVPSKHCSNALEAFEKGVKTDDLFNLYR